MTKLKQSIFEKFSELKWTLNFDSPTLVWPLNMYSVQYHRNECPWELWRKGSFQRPCPVNWMEMTSALAVPWLFSRLKVMRKSMHCIQHIFIYTLLRDKELFQQWACSSPILITSFLQQHTKRMTTQQNKFLLHSSNVIKNDNLTS